MSLFVRIQGHALISERLFYFENRDFEPFFAYKGCPYMRANTVIGTRLPVTSNNSFYSLERFSGGRVYLGAS